MPAVFEVEQPQAQRGGGSTALIHHPGRVLHLLSGWQLSPNLTHKDSVELTEEINTLVLI